MIFRHACPLNSLSHNVIVFGLTLQRYGKSREIQKESLLFFLFPRRSIFGEAKVTNKRGQYKMKARFYFYCRAKVTSAKPKVIYLPQITQKKRIFLFEITRIIKTTTNNTNLTNYSKN